MTTPPSTLLVNAALLARRVTAHDYIAAVEHAFRELADGTLVVPSPSHIGAIDGGFHVKSAVDAGDPALLAIKINGNFPHNPARHGLPTIQGFIALFDARRGNVLALIDSGEVTAQRTAATTTVAAHRLARPDSRRLAVIGCGVQARHHVVHLATSFPFDGVACFDRDGDSASAFASWIRALGMSATVARSAQAAAVDADIVVTCTPSSSPVLFDADIREGCFVAAVGADNPAKHEIAPGLLANATVVVDLVSQASTMGDLHHAIAVGAMRAEDVHAELADIVGGRRAGRTSPRERCVFDSTGCAIADLAAARMIYARLRNDPDVPRCDLATAA
jgi:alanine dehydrogenase